MKREGVERTGGTGDAAEAEKGENRRGKADGRQGRDQGSQPPVPGFPAPRLSLDLEKTALAVEGRGKIPLPGRLLYPDPEPAPLFSRTEEPGCDHGDHLDPLCSFPQAFRSSWARDASARDASAGGFAGDASAGNASAGDAGVIGPAASPGGARDRGRYRGSGNGPPAGGVER